MVFLLFYIYAFSRHFYPKQLTVHSGYTFFLSVHVFLGTRTHNLCAANAMLYHWATWTHFTYFIINRVCRVCIWLIFIFILRNTESGFVQVRWVNRPKCSLLVYSKHHVHTQLLCTYSRFLLTWQHESCQSRHGKQSNWRFLFEKVTRIFPSKLKSNALLCYLLNK